LKDEDVKKIENEIQSALNTKDVFMISAFTGKGTRELLNKLETEVCKS
jgi:GTPase Era involved in 16S rRNA processing